jgi:hypothetical protein
MGLAGAPPSGKTRKAELFYSRGFLVSGPGAETDRKTTSSSRLFNN